MSAGEIEAGAASGVLSPTHARKLQEEHGYSLDAHGRALAARDATIAELRARIRELEAIR